MDRPENIVRRNLIDILAHRYSKAIISHRIAMEIRPLSSSEFFLTNSNYRRVTDPTGINLNFVKVRRV